jgi:hypothetical protein
MHTDCFPEEEYTINEWVSIRRALYAAILTQIHSNVIISSLIGQYYQIRKDVHVIRIINEGGLKFFNEVPGLSFDDSSKATVQNHQHLIFFFILQWQVILLINFVVALDCLLQVNIIYVSFLYFGCIVS